MIKLMEGDCLDLMWRVSEKSVDLIISDWPYNIKKADWDKFDSKKSYLDFIEAVLNHYQRILKDNGSFYFFHNEFLQVVEIQKLITEKFPFIFQQLIIWNKRFNEAKNKGFLDGFIEVEHLRNYQQMNEYILFYNNGNLFQKILNKRIKELNLKEGDFRKLKLSRNGLQTGWCSNILNGKNIPIKKEWELIETLIGNFEYNELEATFNNQKTHHSVWDYEIAPKIGHATPKPIELIENIIKHSSNEGDTVGDFFFGSGTTPLACKNLNRNFIGVERDSEHFKTTEQRIKVEEHQL